MDRDDERRERDRRDRRAQMMLDEQKRERNRILAATAAQYGQPSAFMEQQKAVVRGVLGAEVPFGLGAEAGNRQQNSTRDVAEVPEELKAMEHSVDGLVQSLSLLESLLAPVMARNVGGEVVQAQQYAAREAPLAIQIQQLRARIDTALHYVDAMREVCRL